MKKIYVALNLLFILCFISNPADAEKKLALSCWLPGNEFILYWKEYKKYDLGLPHDISAVTHFMGYIAGFLESSQLLIDPDQRVPFFDFFSNSITQQQAALVVGKYIDDNPQQHHLCAWNLTFRALRVFSHPKYITQ